MVIETKAKCGQNSGNAYDISTRNYNLQTHTKGRSFDIKFRSNPTTFLPNITGSRGIVKQDVMCHIETRPTRSIVEFSFQVLH